jgi:uncharacterized ParB-like nuclease family protein
LGDGSPDGPHVEEDNEIARLTIRYILMNTAITAPIPGLASPEQVDNMVRAIKERRELDLLEGDDSAAGIMPPIDLLKLDRATAQMWHNLERQYRWLKNWRYV